MIKNEDDLPKSIVLILVILAVLISVLGTFTVLTEINKLNNAQTQNSNNYQNAKITLKVVNPNEKQIGVTGKVTLTVLEK
ncbi:MAG: hypothetical protein QXM96_03695 [Candidatus Woesearchaeota archaeon]